MTYLSFKQTAVAVVTSSTLGLIGLTGGCSSSAATADDACVKYFNAALSERCSSDTVSSDRRGQIQTRFLELCKKAIAAPGTGLTPAYLESCANATASLTCGAPSSPKECENPTGSLADGSPCYDSSQCSSGDCKKATTVSTSDAGTTSDQADCGVCIAALAEGASCTADVKCVKGTTCAGQGANGTCTKTVENDVGAACDFQVQKCKTGLRCVTHNGQGGTCAAPAPAGAACSSNSDCQQPDLGCVAKVCKARVGDGAACTSQSECKTGLACNPATSKCGTRPNAKAGAPCDVFTVCDAGSCVITSQSGNGGTGTCPTIIADRQPCNSEIRTAVCDQFASCKQGTCKVADASACNK